ncbi:MAG: NUDIX domain-containing protein [Polyangiaceae bacterium]
MALAVRRACCWARAEIPAAKERRAVPKLAFTAAIVERDGEVLLGQRPTDGLFGGLWSHLSSRVAARAARPRLPPPASSSAPAARAQPAVVHVLTHRVMNIAPIAARVGEGRVGEPAPYTRFAGALPGESVRLEPVDARAGPAVAFDPREEGPRCFSSRRT